MGFASQVPSEVPMETFPVVMDEITGYATYFRFSCLPVVR